MIKRTALLLIGFFALMAAKAQSVTGRVIDEQSQPMPLVNVALVAAADSSFIAGTVTRDDGTFSIAHADYVGDLLKASSVGYKTVFIKVGQASIGDIRMQPDTQALGEIVVKDYRPIVRREHEKTIFDLGHMPKIEALKGMDVMKYVPRVIVSPDGSISVADKKAAVFVNDRQLSDDEQTAYLSSLRASDIERIEVTQNHGGVNDASIEGGVINIVAKKNVVGLNASADIYASTPESGYYDLMPTANLFFGTERWNLYGTYSYTQDKNKQWGETTNDYLYNGTRHYSEGNYYANLKKHVYRFGAMYSLSHGHTLGVEMNGFSKSPTTNKGINSQTYTIEGQPHDGEALQRYTSHTDFYNIVGFYRWNIDSRKSFLKFLFNYNDKRSKVVNELNSNYPTLSSYDASETDITRSSGDNVSSTIDFRKNYASGWSLRASGKMLLSNRGSHFSSSDELVETNSCTDWDYRENIYGGYLGFSKEVGKCYLYGSLRVENTAVRGRASGNESTRKNYTDWFPYVYASYKTSAGYNYSLSYTRTIFRPPYSLMNGHVNRISDVLYDKGNPDLKAELTDFVDFTLSHGRHTLSMKYRHKPNAITELFTVENGITYHTNVNYGSVSSATLSYSYSGNILGWWQTNLFMAGSYTSIPRSYNKTHLLSGLVSWNNRVTWKNVCIISVGLYATSPTIIGNAYQKGFSTVDVSVERQFLKNALTLQIGINDLFDGIKTRISNRVPTLCYDVYLKNQTRQAWCRLTYNLPTKSKVSKRRIQNDNDVKDRL